MKNDSAQRVAVNSALRAIPKLIEASKLGMEDQALRIGEEIAVLLDASMPTVSDRIRKISTKQRGLTPLNIKPPEDILEYMEAGSGFENVVLTQQVIDEARTIISEHSRAAELLSFDVAPRHKVILHGPPGNGKTMLAKAFASELGLPIFGVKYGGLIASYLGETGKNMQRMFDYVATADCVLFIDELDTVGISRTTANDVGEARRATNQMLLLLDRLPVNCFLIAATNLFDNIDPALARRFDCNIEVAAPTPALVRDCVRRELSPHRTPGFDKTSLEDRIEAMKLPDLSAVVEVCRRIRRDLCLTKGEKIETILKESVDIESQPTD